MHAAVKAFVAMAALGIVLLVGRHVAWSSIVPLTLSIMRDISQGAFHRVQRFSTDWHNNSFAGSTVRKITRGMWALDSINDILLLMLWPSCIVLVGTVVLLGYRWPVMGLVMGIGVIAYDAVSAAGDAHHRAGLASFECVGYAHRRRSFRLAGFERSREGVRRRSP